MIAYAAIDDIVSKLTNALAVLQIPAQQKHSEDEILTPDQLAKMFKVGRDLRFKRSEVITWFENQAE